MSPIMCSVNSDTEKPRIDPVSKEITMFLDNITCISTAKEFGFRKTKDERVD